MELNQLRYFVKLSEVQNFSKAAEELFIAQPTLSQQIKQLEKELGVELFIRTTRSVNLTENGKLCYTHAKAALDSINALSDTANEIQRRKKGHLTVGILAVLPQLNISAALEAFQDKYPKIDVTMEFDWSKALVDQVLQKRLDVAVCKVFWKPDDPNFSRLNVCPVDEGVLQVIVGKDHPLASRSEIRLDELADQKILMADQHACIVHSLNQLMSDRRMEPVHYQFVLSNMTLFKMIQAGRGISIMSNDIAHEFNYEDICFIPLVPETKLKTAIITLKGLKADAVPRLFRDHMLDFIMQNSES